MSKNRSPRTVGLKTVPAIACFLVGIASPVLAQDPTASDTVAGNQQVAEIIRTFKGRGVQSDGSSPTPIAESISAFKTRDGLEIELVASEPEISQPLFVSWDSRGRMWVVQYRQYQFPAGLKVVRYDQHLRAVFDKTPLPPPHGDAGEDIISVLTDTDGDGRYDTQKDVISGLNIATSVQVGRGGIWVLNPPYLLFYPDEDQDDVPDGPPEVHLSGFGLQDTHSVANSLLWGPDGWLYGANGSTTTCRISSEVTKNVDFQGQCIWRYHPTSKVFEIYAEGGGNTFSLEIDSKGRVFAGHNGGNTRGWYFPQGSYSQKNWGKHGPLTNPYAFGHFKSMKMEGDTRRFPQAFLIYEGGLMHDFMGGDIIAPNSLHNVVWHDEFLANGSTFKTIANPNLVETTDRWFRPVHCGVGPDGCVYITDWSDTRLSHVSPIDDWHKESGRIYRVQPSNVSPKQEFADLRSESTARLIDRLSDSNKWVRKRAALELGWRNDETATARLTELVDEGSLDALWAIHAMDQLTTPLAIRWLSHSNPDIRRTTIRLLGDRREGVPEMAQAANVEEDVHVRSQLASTAKRVNDEYAFPIIEALISHDGDAADAHLPLLIWWAVEAHADNWRGIRSFAADRATWRHPLFADHIAGRLMQRYAMQGDADHLKQCAELFNLAPDNASKQTLMAGLNRAFEGLTIPELPDELSIAIRQFQRSIGDSDLVLRLRQGDRESIQQAERVLTDSRQPISLRSAIIKTIGQAPQPELKDPLLRLASGQGTNEASLQRLAIQSIRSFDDPKIAGVLLGRFDSSIAATGGVRDAACRTLASRSSWAKAFLRELEQWRILPDDVPQDVVQQLQSYDDPVMKELLAKVFGKTTVKTSEQSRLLINQLRKRLVGESGSVSGNFDKGEKLFVDNCGKCHQLFGEGQAVGPKLDGYERDNLDFWLIAIVAPNAEIREGYQSYAAVTHDGRVLTGMMSDQSTKTITLRDAANRLTIVKREDLEVLRAIPTSLMPQDTVSALTDQQLRDLFVYLMRSDTNQ